ncbi:MAG: response regulator [Candidatus Hodarchaeota archaeon]
MLLKTDFNVLLIDDNIKQAGIIIETLEISSTNKINVFWHKSGYTALDFLNTEGNPVISVILLEIEISDSLGEEIVIQIKSDFSLHRNIPIVIFSNSTNFSQVKYFFSLGINSWVKKPPDPDMLRKKLNTIREFWFNHAILPTTLT